MEKTIKLQPVAMRVPTSNFVYAISKLEKPQTLPMEKFLNRYADHSRQILVSFDEDGYSNPVGVTAYGLGLDCWYIIAE